MGLKKRWEGRLGRRKGWKEGRDEKKKGWKERGVR